MNSTRTRGLTLGKYAPLHRGHQLVIETALAEMDELVVIIYDSPEVTPVPLSVRAGWLRRLYPAVRVVEAWDGPSEVGDTPEIKRRHEDYVIERLKIAGVTHFYSSEFYGEHMSQALGAVNRVVDARRERVPISATQIRRDPFACREYLHPLVYRDLVAKIALLGAPGSGAEALAARLAADYATVHLPAPPFGAAVAPDDLAAAEAWLEHEERLAPQANRYLFVASSAVALALETRARFGDAPERLRRLALEERARYDAVFVCEPAPHAEGAGPTEQADRLVLHRRLCDELAALRQPFFALRGSLEERAARAKAVLARHAPYQNLAALVDR